MVVANKVRENDIQEIFPDAGSVRLAFGGSGFPQCRNKKLEIDRVNREPQRGKFLRNCARADPLASERFSSTARSDSNWLL
jgi:hypothetical protein